jgi:hypothetical protein
VLPAHIAVLEGCVTTVGDAFTVNTAAAEFKGEQEPLITQRYW